MSFARAGGLLASAALLGLGVVVVDAPAGVKEAALGAHTIYHELVLPGSPESIYDTVTGDISGWWDHTFSESPRSFYIEPKPGGGFYEIFDDAGNGVLHGTVIYAHRGRKLTFRGPLGFSGKAVDLVVTYDFEAQGDSTLMKVTVSKAGVDEGGWAEAIDGVWRHFLFDGLKPYVESGANREG